MPHLTHFALSWSFFPLLFFLLFPLCFSKLLSLSCFLFLFFASRFPSPVCCHPWLFMVLQNFSAHFHLSGAQPLSILRSFLVVVEISYGNLATFILPPSIAAVTSPVADLSGPSQGLALCLPLEWHPPAGSR